MWQRMRGKEERVTHFLPAAQIGLHYDPHAILTKRKLPYNPLLCSYPKGAESCVKNAQAETGPPRQPAPAGPGRTCRGTQNGGTRRWAGARALELHTGPGPALSAKMCVTVHPFKGSARVGTLAPYRGRWAGVRAYEGRFEAP